LALLALGVLLAWHSGDDAHSGEAAVDGSMGTISGATKDDNWPQFRGPGGLGISDETSIPTSWSETESILWKTPIEGRGHSSPVVWGDRIFLTTAIEGEVIPGADAPIHYIGGEPFKHPQSLGANRHHTLEVLTLDRNSGEILWSHVVYEGRVYDNRHEAASYASPTAVTDGELVYFYFGSQGLYVYDFDGEQVWDASLGDIGSFGVGIGTSPVLFEELLIVLVDEDEGEESFIVALDKKTGDEVWRKPRPVEASWATPLLIEDAGGRPQLLTTGIQFLISYDPATGEELWRLDGLANNAIHAPLWDGERVYMTAGYPRSVVKAIHLAEGGDGPTAEIAWEYRKGAAYVSSNLVYGDYVYVTNDKGIITCLDAATGEVVYEGGRTPNPASMLISSLLGVDGKIVMSTPEGETFFITAGPEFEVASSGSIDEPISATPAIVDGKIYLRGHRHLYAIGSESGAP
jgi:outer membrane protein assembly factor BamB